MTKKRISLYIRKFLAVFLLLCIVPFSQPALADTTPTPQPVFDYTGNPNYSPYYNFAKTNLFDGVDFFVQNAPRSSCADPNPANPEAILQGWGFTVDGAEKTAAMVNETYNTICILYQFSKFKDVLGATTSTINISFTPPRQNGDIGGFMADLNHVEMVGISSVGDVYFRRFVLIHELAHVLSNKQEGQQVFAAFFEKGHDALLTALGQESSLNCPGGNDNPAPYSDCFADMVASYIVGTNYNRSFGDFATNISFLPYYQLIRDKIFGGLSFGTSPAGLADYATLLANAIITSCGRYVNSGNIGCLDNINIPLDHKTDVITILKASVGAGNLQCVGFVQGATIGIGLPIGHAGGKGNASDFVPPTTPSIPGYTWVPMGRDFTFQTGDVLVQAYGVDHIAIITDINPDNTTAKVAEANGGDGSVWVIQSDSTAQMEQSLAGVWRISQ